jgi:hypothetical protein
MSTKIPLIDLSSFGPVKDGAPSLKLANPVRSVLRVKFCHPP